MLLKGHADNINIMGRTQGAVCDVYEELRERAKEVGLNIVGGSTKQKMKNSEILKIKDQDSEAVRSFKYLGTVINNTNNETEEIKARILAANKANSSLQTKLRSKQIHQNNKIRLYKTLIKPVLCYGSVTWTLTQMTDQMICIYERKIENTRPIYRIYRIEDIGILDGKVKFIIYTKISISWMILKLED